MAVSTIPADQLASRLREVLPGEAIVTDPDALAEAGRDQTETAPITPAVLVRLSDRAHIPDLLRFCTAHGLPVTPRVAGSNLGGLTIPAEGGIVLDLSQMNRIVEVNVEDGYVRLEPGVTWEQLKAYLEEHKIALRIGYPLSPPDSSVMANCLLDGLGNLSMRHGAMGEWLNGLEVVLPTGETVRTGAGALSWAWFSRAPLPDLTGLFVNWQGTTGVVTEAAVQLWPLRPFRRRAFVLTYDRAAAFRVMRELAGGDIFDDVGGLSWPTGKMLFGVTDPGPRDPAEPDFFLYLDLSADTKRELDLRWSLLEDRLRSLQRQGVRTEPPLTIEQLLVIEPAFARLAEFPTRLDFLLDHPAGGLTWVGTYGPMSRFEVACDPCVKMMEDEGRPPIIVSRPMKGGHFGVLRFISVFAWDDPAERARVADLNMRLMETCMAHGFIPYKTPPWAVAALADRLDPGMRLLLDRVKDALDPAGIMNPGKWGFSSPTDRR